MKIETDRDLVQESLHYVAPAGSRVRFVRAPLFLVDAIRSTNTHGEDVVGFAVHVRVVVNSTIDKMLGAAHTTYFGTN